MKPASDALFALPKQLFAALDVFLWYLLSITRLSKCVKRNLSKSQESRSTAPTSSKRFQSKIAFRIILVGNANASTWPSTPSGKPSQQAVKGSLLEKEHQVLSLKVATSLRAGGMPSIEKGAFNERGDFSTQYTVSSFQNRAGKITSRNCTLEQRKPGVAEHD